MVRPVVTASVPACRRRPSGGAPAAGPRCPSASKGCSGGISGWSGAAGAGGGVQHRDGGLRALPAVARQVEDQLRHVVQRLDVRPRLGAGVVGGLDDPEVHAVVPGRPAAGHGERGGVLRGAVPPAPQAAARRTPSRPRRCRARRGSTRPGRRAGTGSPGSPAGTCAGDRGAGRSPACRSGARGRRGRRGASALGRRRRAWSSRARSRRRRRTRSPPARRRRGARRPRPAGLGGPWRRGVGVVEVHRAAGQQGPDPEGSRADAPEDVVGVVLPAERQAVLPQRRPVPPPRAGSRRARRPAAPPRPPAACRRTCCTATRPGNPPAPPWCRTEASSPPPARRRRSLGQPRTWVNSPIGWVTCSMPVIDPCSR